MVNLLLQPWKLSSPGSTSSHTHFPKLLPSVHATRSTTRSTRPALPSSSSARWCRCGRHPGASPAARETHTSWRRW
ncbi:hypothetical protein B0H10DRAFT_2438079, partial [Mycena sp. CBHHK59/15]